MFRFVHVSHDNETDRVVETVEMEINSSDQWTDVADFFLRFLQASDFGYLTRQKLSDHFDDGEFCDDCSLRKEQLDLIEVEEYSEEESPFSEKKADVYINLFTDEVTVDE